MAASALNIHISSSGPGCKFANEGGGAAASTSPSLPAQLHEDLCRHIVDYLDIFDRNNLSMVCKTFHSHLKHEVRIATRAVRLFPHDPEQSIDRLTSLRFIPDTAEGIARFLHQAHGKLPAACIGRYLSHPPEVDPTVQAQRAAELTIAYLRLVDFSCDTPVQALRRLLSRTRMPSGSRTASAFFKRLAYRYVECQQAWKDSAPLKQAPLLLCTAGGDAPAGVSNSSKPVTSSATEQRQFTTTSCTEHSFIGGGGAAGGSVRHSATRGDTSVSAYSNRVFVIDDDDDDDDGGADSGASTGSGAPADPIEAFLQDTVARSERLWGAADDTVSATELSPTPSTAGSPAPSSTLAAFPGSAISDAVLSGAASPTSLHSPSLPSVSVSPPQSPSTSTPPSSATALSAPAPVPGHVVYGFDLSTLDVDTAFVLIYSCIILNTDMRSAAIKAKMSRQDFVSRNSTVPGLLHIPASFFSGLYDELAVQGLPVGDHVPLEPVRHASPRQPAPETVAALRHLVRSPTQVVWESAGAAFGWLRRAVSSLPILQTPPAGQAPISPASVSAGAGTGSAAASTTRSASPQIGDGAAPTSGLAPVAGH